jgi:hypothetical protein
MMLSWKIIFGKREIWGETCKIGNISEQFKAMGKLYRIYREIVYQQINNMKLHILSTSI